MYGKIWFYNRADISFFMGNSTHATALREGEPQAKTDRQSATAKEDRSKRTYEKRTSIPYGKGKVNGEPWFVGKDVAYQFPMGKVKRICSEVSRS